MPLNMLLIKSDKETRCSLDHQDCFSASDKSRSSISLSRRDTTTCLELAIQSWRPSGMLSPSNIRSFSHCWYSSATTGYRSRGFRALSLTSQTAKVKPSFLLHFGTTQIALLVTQLVQTRSYSIKMKNESRGPSTNRL